METVPKNTEQFNHVSNISYLNSVYKSFYTNGNKSGLMVLKQQEELHLFKISRLITYLN